jgi:hypothetical protein
MVYGILVYWFFFFNLFPLLCAYQEFQIGNCGLEPFANTHWSQVLKSIYVLGLSKSSIDYVLLKIHTSFLFGREG